MPDTLKESKHLGTSRLSVLRVIELRYEPLGGAGALPSGGKAR